MLIFKTIRDVRQAVVKARGDEQVIGLVPTMGALHEGHRSLIRAARQECGFVAVSIFVNPIQFGPGEDFQSYPRPIESDLTLCRHENVDLVFNPEPAEMYPAEPLTTVQVAKLTGTLCGAFRPGHFTGVTTVVTKLFNIVQPDRAYFGQKDAQQALVIRRMVRDLDIPVTLRICPTVREASGLALSSRNQYLSDAERRQAACLYRSLQLARRLAGQGTRDSGAITAAVRAEIEAAGPCRIQYVSVVDAESLQDVDRVDRPVLVALAVKIGPARLIDNIIMDSDGREIIMADL